MSKKIYFAGIGAYVVMLIFSVLFYKERTIFLDSAYDIFHIIQDQTLVNHNRFGGFFTKLLPFIAFKMALSLHAVLMAYSIGFTMYNLVCYVICGSVLKKYDFALVILLCNILFVSETFYYIPSELPLGMAFLTIVLAFTDKLQYKADVFALVLTAILVIAATFFHPLIVFVIFYAAVFFILQQTIYANAKRLYFVFGVFMMSLVLKTLLIRTPYEQHSMGGLRNFVTLFPHYIKLYSNKQFLHNCLTLYYWIPVGCGAIAVFYTINKEWKKLAFFTVYFTGYLFLVDISYATKATPSYYMENLYLPMGMYLALPIVFDILPFLEKKRLTLPVVLLILVTGCARIYSVHTRFTARLDYERAILTQYGDKKVVLDAKKVNAGILQMLWGTPYEFWLLSTSEQNRTASIIIDENPKRLEWGANMPKSLIVNWNVYPYSELPERYFKLADTTTGYVIDPIPAGN
jgi:hypothetical protein